MSDDGEMVRRAEQRVGSVLKGKYRIDRVLGIGGMAVVYVVTHRNQKRFALKMLHPELSMRGDIRARFQREGYAANSVDHPGVVAVLDDDVADDGAAFLVMELLDGVSIEQLLEGAGHRLPLKVAGAIVHELLDVLAVAHEKGVVHRDIKPANLFLTSEGRLKVLDFGIARVRDAAFSDGPHTSDGTILGTPAFMAPEQALARAREIDARTDVWAAGATLFTLHSGQSVQEGESAAELLIRAATIRARSLSSVVPGVAASIAAVVDRALAFEREARWQSASAMRDALAEAHSAAFGEFRPREELAALASSARGSASGGAQRLQDGGVESHPRRSAEMPAVTPASLVAFEEAPAGVPKRARALAISLQDFAILSPSKDVSVVIDSFFRESASAKLDGRGASSDVPSPPDPLRGTLDLRKPMVAKPVDLQRMSRSPFIHSTLDFLLQDTALDAPLICHWPGGQVLSCRKIPPPAAAMSPGLQLWGTNAEDVPPFVFAGKRGQAGIFRSDTGERVVESLPFDGAYGAFSRKAGTLEYLQWQDASPHMLLRRISAGEPTTEHGALDKEAIRFPYFSTELAWDWFAYRAQVDEQLRLFVRGIGPTGALGPVEDVGFVAEGGMVEKDDHGEPHMSGCRSARSMVLRVKGYNRQFLSFRADGRWTPPVIALHMGGSLTCTNAEAVVTTANWTQMFSGVSRSGCSLAGCKVDNNDLPSLRGVEITPRAANDVAVFDVNGKTLLLWYAGTAGGLRMRYAPIDQLDTAADTLLFDDHIKDGAFSRQSAYVAFRAMQTSEGTLLLLVQTTSGIHAFTFNAAGTFTPADTVY